MLLLPPSLEIRAAALGLGCFQVARTLDVRLHAELHAALEPGERLAELVRVCSEETAQVVAVAVDRAEAAGHDRRAREHGFEHLLVRANLLLEPLGVSEPL
jgi:hypothetical protein